MDIVSDNAQQIFTFGKVVATSSAQLTSELLTLVCWCVLLASLRKTLSAFQYRLNNAPQTSISTQPSECAITVEAHALLVKELQHSVPLAQWALISEQEAFVSVAQYALLDFTRLLLAAKGAVPNALLALI